MNSKKISALQASYNKIAVEYVQRIYDELDHKPLDRELLDRFAERIQGKGPICDLGCGPGHVARYLSERGVEVFGIDLSPAMVEQAGQLNPEIPFKTGNMLALEEKEESWGGIVAFYSIIHVPPDAVVAALCEMRRVLRPGGSLFLAFHQGDEAIHLDEWWGQPVSIDTYFFSTNEMLSYLNTAGFEIEEVVERPPYEGFEYPSHRTYILAIKPALPEK